MKGGKETMTKPEKRLKGGGTTPPNPDSKGVYSTIGKRRKNQDQWGLPGRKKNVGGRTDTNPELSAKVLRSGKLCGGGDRGGKERGTLCNRMDNGKSP